MTIAAIPTQYRGMRFRSTLEADWAATFDSLDWYWQYEPEAFMVDGVPYRPDFYLPTMRVWCEVKGPHDERLDKTAAFYTALGPDPWDVGRPLVVVLRPAGPGDIAQWDSADAENLVIVKCPDCEHFTFLDSEGAWQCRRCFYGNHSTHDNKFWARWHQPRTIQFVRVPRPQRRAAR